MIMQDSALQTPVLDHRGLCCWDRPGQGEKKKNDRGAHLPGPYCVLGTVLSCTWLMRIILCQGPREEGDAVTGLPQSTPAVCTLPWEDSHSTAPTMSSFPEASLVNVLCAEFCQELPKVPADVCIRAPKAHCGLCAPPPPVARCPFL